LIRQVTENITINVIFGEALGVLRHAELVEPVRNPLHRGSYSRFAAR
jgi:hypothetical protein